MKNNKNSNLKTIKINDTKINIEEAKTPAEKSQGLSDRSSLPANQGMLFYFDTLGNYSFWMKGMNFPLDFIWISGNEIVEINEDIKPSDYQPPKSLIPKNEVDKVLEVNAGFSKKNNIKIGDKVQF
jgi:uncharacterized membrane protein (UPF0127 family)